MDTRELKRRAAGRLRALPAHALVRPPLLWRQFVIGLIGGLACAGAAGLANDASQQAAAWTRTAGQTLIVVPDAAAPTATGHTRLEAALAAAGPGAAQVDQADITGLLGAAAQGVTLPAMITTNDADPGLAARLEAASPGSVVQTGGGAPSVRLAGFGFVLATLGDIALALCAIVFVTCAAAAAAAAIRARAAPISLLHQLGTTSGRFSRLLVWPLAATILLGAGLGAAAVTLVLGLPAIPVWLGPASLAAVPLAPLATWLAASLSLRRGLDAA
jgi:hypothetical protein